MARAIAVVTDGHGSNFKSIRGIYVMTGCRIPIDSAVDKYLHHLRSEVAKSCLAVLKLLK